MDSIHSNNSQLKEFHFYIFFIFFAFSLSRIERRVFFIRARIRSPDAFPIRYSVSNFRCSFSFWHSPFAVRGNIICAARNAIFVPITVKAAFMTVVSFVFEPEFFFFFWDKFVRMVEGNFFRY